MRVSAKCDYACRALLELSLQYGSKGPTQINTIAENQQIPVKYLVQILIQLKRARLVDSVRGKTGGYFLSRHPEQIRLGEVIRLIDGPLVSINCIDKRSRAQCSLEAKCGFKPVWSEVQEKVAEVLDNISFEDICTRVRMSQEILDYQI